MSNTRKIRDTRRLGLVEVEVDDAKHQVVLTMHPPGADAATVLMGHQDAIDLARGLIEGADQALGRPQPSGRCIWCAQSLIVEGLPDV